MPRGSEGAPTARAARTRRRMGALAAEGAPSAATQRALRSLRTAAARGAQRARTPRWEGPHARSVPPTPTRARARARTRLLRATTTYPRPSTGGSRLRHLIPSHACGRTRRAAAATGQWGPLPARPTASRHRAPAAMGRLQACARCRGRGGTFVQPGYGPIRCGRFGVKNARVVKKVGEKQIPLGEKETPPGEKVTIFINAFLALAGLISRGGGRWRRGTIAGDAGPSWLRGGWDGGGFGRGRVGRAGRVFGGGGGGRAGRVEGGGVWA